MFLTRQKMYLIFIVCSYILIFTVLQKQKDEHSDSDDGTAKVDTVERSVDRLSSILQSCGQLCDFSIIPKPSHFLDVRKTQVDCRAIFLNDEIDQPLKGNPPKWSEVPTAIQDALTHSGAVAKADWYEDNSHLGGDMKEDDPTTYSEQDINKMVENVKNGRPAQSYGGAARDILATLKEAVQVKDKHILVIGSQSPWVEAILLYYGAGKITTLEYGKFVSNHPRLDYMRPNEFRSKYLSGTLPVFDVVFTYSSVEHSGLGRYGDALNPWGDILTIARAWCASSPTANLAIAVPVNHKKDCIVFNVHRIYGKILYPFLVTNWRFNWSSTGKTETGSDACEYTQPIYLFNKL